MTDLAEDARWMKRALDLARRAKGRTSPNPTVGAVVVRQGHCVGKSYHPRAGQPHAEILALRQAGHLARGATLYVTLEPCVHHGQTPPCVDAVLEAGVARVVVAMEDPNPRVSGRGLKRLTQRGVQVECGLLQDRARALNEDFVKFHVAGVPFVTVKMALTLDGKIATAGRQSQWITGEKARRYVQRLRHEHDAVLVGIGTVLADNPRLTTRLPGGKDPQRIVADSRARLPLTSRLVGVQSPAATWVATTSGAPQTRVRRLTRAGVRILETPSANGRVDLSGLMTMLAAHNMLSVLIEGGGELVWSAMESGIVDKIAFFVAPKIIGGHNALTPVEGLGRCLEDAWNIREMKVKRVGDELLVEGYVDTAGPRTVS